MRLFARRLAVTTYHHHEPTIGTGQESRRGDSEHALFVPEVAHRLVSRFVRPHANLEPFAGFQLAIPGPGEIKELGDKAIRRSQ
jgi:hypothetical protein